LRTVINDLKSNYFNPAYLKEIDLDGRAREAEKKIDQAQSVFQLYGIIGQILIDFNEPGTFFLPPTIMRMPDYGFNWAMVGNQCLVTYVAPDSDASLKGLKSGDQILAFDQIVPSREIAWKIKNLFFLVRPRQALPLQIKSVDGSERQIEIGMKYTNATKGAITESSFEKMMTKIENTLAARDKSINGEVYIWRGSDAARNGSADINAILRHKGVVLDLRGCCLADKDDLEALKKTMGYYTDKNVKIADLVSRGKTKSIQVKSGGNKVFKGKIIVLVDSETKSVGELIARLVQLEKLGQVLGDQTKGSVRLSTIVADERHVVWVSATTALVYGTGVTTTEVLMSDGQTLQKVGVIPDIFMLPTAADLSAGRDPVLAKAVEMLGGVLSPEEAGKLFPSNFTLWLW